MTHSIRSVSTTWDSDRSTTFIQQCPVFLCCDRRRNHFGNSIILIAIIITSTVVTVVNTHTHRLPLPPTEIPAENAIQLVEAQHTHTTHTLDCQIQLCTKGKVASCLVGPHTSYSHCSKRLLLYWDQWDSQTRIPGVLVIVACHCYHHYRQSQRQQRDSVYLLENSTL